MERVYMRFPSGRTFQISEDISQVRPGKRPIIVFWDEETLKENFEIETRAGMPECYCFFASPSKIGVKNVTKREGSFFVILCNSREARECIGSGVRACGEDAESRLSFFILSEERAKTGSPIVEFSGNLCPDFYVYALDSNFPVSLSPFSFTSIPFPHPDEDLGLLSLGDEMDFSLAYLEKGKITISPNYGELAGFYEIDEMDKLINSVMGHLHFRNVTVLREESSYSLTANYVRRFAHARSVNHLFSHAAAVMHDNGCTEKPGLCIVYDSQSIGENDLIQGSEILYGQPGSFEIVARWRPLPLPGGDIANVEPWRIALATLKEAMKSDISKLDIPLVQNLRDRDNSRVVFNAINNGDISYSLSSSMHHIIAAIGEMLDFEESTWDFDFFENLMDRTVLADYSGEFYPVGLKEEDGVLILDSWDLFRGIAQDIFAKVNPENMVYKTIFGISKATVAAMEKLSKKFGAKSVFLTGEFFKHPHFTDIFYSALTAKNLSVMSHKTIPVDDSAISIGQLIHYYWMKKREKPSK